VSAKSLESHIQEVTPAFTVTELYSFFFSFTFCSYDIKRKFSWKQIIWYQETKTIPGRKLVFGRWESKPAFTAKIVVLCLSWYHDRHRTQQHGTNTAQQEIEAKYTHHHKAIEDKEADTTDYVSSHNERKSIHQLQKVNGGFKVFWFLKVVFQK
jgi:hypothetical protein